MLRRLAPSFPSRRSVETSERELHEQERFLDLVRKERVRSDRTGDELSLVTIRFGAADRADGSGMRHALEQILRRVRCLDEVGWMRAGTLGILLPATPVEGARKLIDDLGRNDITGHLRLGRWTVYTYPDSWLGEGAAGGGHGNENSDGNGHGGGGGNGRLRVERRGEQSETPSSGGSIRPAMAVDDSTAVLRSVRDVPGRGPTVARAEVRPLVDLLVERLPWWKRALDVAGASLALILLSPVMLAAAAAVKLTSPGPVLYASWRCGVGGRRFRFYKFRTMFVGADARKKELLERNEASGPVFKMANDPRITPVGRLLRRLSIDELPQLWNVVKGDMSLVGPRPPIPEETRFYAPWQRRRLEGTGGLTCIWQVSGRSDVQFEDWVRMDLAYLEARSFWLDLAILLRTIPAVFSCRGAR